MLVVSRSGRKRLRIGLRVDFRRMVARGFADVEPGGAGADEVLGGNGCGG